MSKTAQKMKEFPRNKAHRVERKTLLMMKVCTAVSMEFNLFENIIILVIILDIFSYLREKGVMS